MFQNLIPDDLRYTKDHEWVRREDDGTFTVGITDHAQHELGGVVFVDLPSVGSRVEAGKPCGEIESTKTVPEIFAPLTGEVVAVNDKLTDNPELVNERPYDEGWMFRVAAKHPADFDQLLDAAAYRAFVEGSAD